MKKTPFQIHPQLLLDCHQLCIVEKFHILLHKNASIPWFILVPETNVKEIHDLSKILQLKIFELTNLISDYFKRSYQIDKMNIASIGNIVDQLHIHVIARKTDDACWPHVVWGSDYNFQPYTDESIKTLTDVFTQFISNETFK